MQLAVDTMGLEVGADSEAKLEIGQFFYYALVIALLKKIKMKRLAVLAALIGSLAHAGEYNFAALYGKCDAANATLSTFRQCLLSGLNRDYPSWRTEDEDAKEITIFFDYLSTLSRQVKAKEIDNPTAKRMAHLEITRLSKEKRDMQLAADTARQREQAKEQEQRRVVEQERLRIERERQASIERERQRDAQMQALIVLQQQQAEQAKNQAMFNAGMQILQMNNQPRYVAPAPLIPYPSDTTININNTRPYRFYDSRPYQ